MERNCGIRLDERRPIIVWARRFAAYKRPEALLSDTGRLHRLLESGLQVVVSGKAHPHDDQGKLRVERLVQAGLEFRRSGLGFVFIPDYNWYLGQALTQGADLWLNTPRRGLEASGTSGMKAAVNGALAVTVSDGWANEVDWRGMGWVLDECDPGRCLWDLLEGEILPSFWARNSSGLPTAWIERMRSAIAHVADRFSTSRMLEQYLSELYHLR